MRHPVSTPGCFEHQLHAAVQGWVVGFAIGPSTPDHAQPGASEDAGCVGMIATARPRFGVEVGGPGIGMARGRAARWQLRRTFMHTIRPLMDLEPVAIYQAHDLGIH